MTRPVVLVPVDGLKDASMSLPVAALLAGLEQASLLAVPIAEPEVVPAKGSASKEPVGEPAEQILELAHELGARLIVMSRRTAAGAERALGVTAIGVLRGAPCPVVLVPPRGAWEPWHLHQVLVPHDGTPTTSAALQPAAELAERAGAELLVAHVAGTGPAPSEPGTFTVFRYMDQPHHAWPVWSNEFAERLACVCPLGHLHVRLRLAHGDPAAQVLKLAKQQSMDLIVLAWRGKWEGRAAILKTVLRGAACPVMALRVSP